MVITSFLIFTQPHRMWKKYRELLTLREDFSTFCALCLFSYLTVSVLSLCSFMLFCVVLCCVYYHNSRLYSKNNVLSDTFFLFFFIFFHSTIPPFSIYLQLTTVHFNSTTTCCLFCFCTFLLFSLSFVRSRSDLCIQTLYSENLLLKGTNVRRKRERAKSITQQSATRYSMNEFFLFMLKKTMNENSNSPEFHSFSFVSSCWIFLVLLTSVLRARGRNKNNIKKE
jgi:hypothetical protein